MAVTFVTAPVSPATVMFDGYGLAFPCVAGGCGWCNRGSFDVALIKPVLFGDASTVTAINIQSAVSPSRVDFNNNLVNVGGTSRWLEFRDVFKIYRSGPAETVALRGLVGR